MVSCAVDPGMWGSGLKYKSRCPPDQLVSRIFFLPAPLFMLGHEKASYKQSTTGIRRTKEAAGRNRVSIILLVPAARTSTTKHITRIDVPNIEQLPLFGEKD